jgi:AraC family transcriptional regulator
MQIPMTSSAPQTDLYHQRVNLVLDTIRVRLTEDLSIPTLAAIAGFSPYHFHRIFRVITGETLADCVLRLRLERAVALLKASRKLSITEAAFACGFVSAAHFSRVFKQQFGLTARAWDRETPLKNSKNGQVLEGFPRYTQEELGATNWSAKLTRRTLPAQTIAYIRIEKPYNNPTRIMRAYDRLWAWYTKKGGASADTTLYGVSQDDPEVTPLALCRFDWCLRVPPHWEGEDAIRVVTWPACEIATVPVQGDIFAVDQAWQFLFNYWLPRSRYWPDNRPAMEIYRSQPAETGWSMDFDLECAMPIVPFSS